MKRISFAVVAVLAIFAAVEISGFNLLSAGQWTELFQKGSKTTVVASKKKATIRNKIGEFSKIENTCSVDVSVRRGEANEVEISGPDNVVGLVYCEVGGGKLKVGFKRGVSISIGSNSPELKVRVTMRSALGSVRNAGSGDFECDKTVDWCNDARIMSQGSGDITIKSIRSSILTVQMAGSADVKVEDVRATLVNIMTTGSGDFLVQSIDCDVLNFNSGGSGDSKIDKTKCSSANLILSGSGDVMAKGFDSTTINVMSSGSGSTLVSGRCVSANFTSSGTGDINARSLTSESVNLKVSGKGDVFYSKPKRG